MSFFVCGDTHGDIDIKKLTTKHFNPAKPLTKDDFVLICGDFGGVWDEKSHDQYIQGWYRQKPWTTLFVDGNHENHDALARYPVSEWNGGKVHIINNSIIHLMRGQVYTIDGHTIFTMGGASSHDKIFRTEGISWWPNEIPSDAEFEEAMDNLKQHDNEVEYIFTHCAGDCAQKNINPYYEKNKLTNFLNIVDEIVKFDKWFFGHYHEDMNVDDRHIALYNSIIKLW